MKKAERSEPHHPDQQEIWDHEYYKKGRLWGNIPHEISAYSGKGVFLDLGCGDGKNLRRIKPDKSLVIGLDFSQHALALCRNNPELNAFAFIYADVRCLPFKKGSVTAADAHHVFGHLLAADRVLAAGEVTRILLPGGSLHITVFGTGDVRNGIGTRVEPGTFLKGTGIITHFFSPDELLSLFPCLQLISSVQHSWPMKIKGQHFVRSVWTASYFKRQNDE